MRRLLIYVFFVIIVFSLVRPAKAVTDCSGIDDASRCTTCDLCGYCLNQTPPACWEGCRNCLYPDLTGSPAEENETLRVEPTTTRRQPLIPAIGTPSSVVSAPISVDFPNKERPVMSSKPFLISFSELPEVWLLFILSTDHLLF